MHFVRYIYAVPDWFLSDSFVLSAFCTAHVQITILQAGTVLPSFSIDAILSFVFMRATEKCEKTVLDYKRHLPVMPVLHPHHVFTMWSSVSSYVNSAFCVQRLACSFPKAAFAWWALFIFITAWWQSLPPWGCAMDKWFSTAVWQRILLHATVMYRQCEAPQSEAPPPARRSPCCCQEVVALAAAVPPDRQTDRQSQCQGLAHWVFHPALRSSSRNLCSSARPCSLPLNPPPPLYWLGPSPMCLLYTCTPSAFMNNNNIYMNNINIKKYYCCCCYY